MRTTSGKVMPPRVRQRYRPTWLMSWSRHGYEKASYCISHTGRKPAMQSPTAEPRIPASASGVSTQRSGPKRSRSPAVARKTPPARPTSSPSTITFASRSISTWSASFTASTSRRSGTEDPPQLGEVVPERLRRIGERVLEDEADVGWKLCLGGGDAGAHEVGGLGLDLLVERVVQDPLAAEVAGEAADALVRPLLLDPLQVDVGLRVVRRRVRRGAVADRFDEGRSAAAAGAGHRLAGGLEDGENVATVHPQPGDPVARRLVGERLRAGLVGERRRDRPLVVVAQKDERCPHDGGEVGALVECAFGGGAVTEERQRAGALAAQPLAPGKPRRVRHLRRDRDADRGDVVVGRVPPAGRVAAPPGEDRRRRHAAEKTDRRLAIAREDPVVVLERVHRARLNCLVAPEDRVRADAALAVVDDGPLVVGAQQHHRPVQRQQLLLPDALDLSVGDGVAVADHSAEIALRGHRGRHFGADDTSQGSVNARASTGSRPARTSAAVGSTGTSGSTARRVSPGATSTHSAATYAVRPARGSSIAIRSPHWLGAPPLRSPTRIAFVSRSTDAAKLPAAEKVIRPRSTTTLPRCFSGPVFTSSTKG